MSPGQRLLSQTSPPRHWGGTKGFGPCTETRVSARVQQSMNGDPGRGCRTAGLSLAVGSFPPRQAANLMHGAAPNPPALSFQHGARSLSASSDASIQRGQRSFVPHFSSLAHLDCSKEVTPPGQKLWAPSRLCLFAVIYLHASSHGSGESNYPVHLQSNQFNAAAIHQAITSTASSYSNSRGKVRLMTLSW